MVKAAKSTIKAGVPRTRKPMVALLIAAHNEELVLSGTIESAIGGGILPQHIYVVDDNSSDNTSKIAKALLPAENVHRVQRSGKGLAIKKATKKFQLTDRYRWIHIADADGRFDKMYFRRLRAQLRVKYAAATGYVRSLPGQYVSQYRVFEYTVGMEVSRRVQSALGVIPIIPGPTSCFRADVFSQLDFNGDTLTEDFDVTLQIYRKKLGKIQYINDAIAYTQDPLTIKHFVKQVLRWNRGVLQILAKHKVYRGISRVDIYLKYQLIQTVLFMAFFACWMPYILLTSSHGVEALSVVFLYDVLVVFALTLFSAVRVRRLDVLPAFPFVYLLRWVGLFVFSRAFIEVVVLRKHRTSSGKWHNDGNRRYKIA